MGEWGVEITHENIHTCLYLYITRVQGRGERRGEREERRVQERDDDVRGKKEQRRVMKKVKTKGDE